MTVIQYRATTLLLRFAELVKEVAPFLTDGQRQQLLAIREMVRNYSAMHFLVELNTQSSAVEGSPILRFVDLLRANEARLMLLDPNYKELHYIADAAVAWANGLGVNLLAERIAPLAKLYKAPKEIPDG